MTDADFMNPSPELLAQVEARTKHYRLIKEERAAKSVETERRHALIERYKQAYLASARLSGRRRSRSSWRKQD